MRGLKPPLSNASPEFIRSHLLQMRGLKLNCVVNLLRHYRVASFTDAWIETFSDESLRTYLRSHLLQMRGLKQPGNRYHLESILSHLLQMRGLKLKNLSLPGKYIKSHLLQMRGLKRTTRNEYKRGVCRIFYRCVD